MNKVEIDRNPNLQAGKAMEKWGRYKGVSKRSPMVVPIPLRQDCHLDRYSRE
jgi:hypothetical protein